MAITLEQHQNCGQYVAHLSLKQTLTVLQHRAQFQTFQCRMKAKEQRDMFGHFLGKGRLCLLNISGDWRLECHVSAAFGGDTVTSKYVVLASK